MKQLPLQCFRPLQIYDVPVEIRLSKHLALADINILTENVFHLLRNFIKRFFCPLETSSYFGVTEGDFIATPRANCSVTRI